jgi:hypothetical protein
MVLKPELLLCGKYHYSRRSPNGIRKYGGLLLYCFH